MKRKTFNQYFLDVILLKSKWATYLLGVFFPCFACHIVALSINLKQIKTPEPTHQKGISNYFFLFIILSFLFLFLFYIPDYAIIKKLLENPNLLENTKLVKSALLFLLCTLGMQCLGTIPFYGSFKREMNKDNFINN